MQNLKDMDLVDFLGYIQTKNLNLKELVENNALNDLNVETINELIKYSKWAQQYELDEFNIENLYLYVYKNDMGVWFDEILPLIEDETLTPNQINAVYDRKQDLISEIKTSVEDEYLAFKEEMLKKSSLEVFESYYEIHFYKELYNYITSNDDLDNPIVTNKYFKCLKKDKGHILDKLYQYYLKSEYARIHTWDDIEDFIKEYCERYYRDILKED